jgi:DNA adenine methylase
LATYIGDVLILNGLKPKLFVEPFAGGASVSLYLLANGLVEKVALGEKDPFLVAFWETVFHDADWLINEIKNTPITLEKWIELKNELTSETKRSPREMAFACLFLNRTSFSGILHPGGGPIGGKSQTSDYKLNCRFPVNKLVKRIRAINDLSPRIEFVNGGGWRSTMQRANELSRLSTQSTDDLFFYLDPPFYHKADRLYPFFFNHRNHESLCKYLSGIKTPWLVSYDFSDEIKKMYSNNGFSARIIDVLYSTSSDGTKKAKELIITNLHRTPDKTEIVP